MALVLCQECGQTISDRAVFCPACGWPVRELIDHLKNQQAHVRLRFNPLRRPGKLRFLLGGGLLYCGVMLATEPAFLGQDLMLMGQKFAFDPLWFKVAGGLFLLWGLVRFLYWGCDHCGGILPGRRASRCPYCLWSLSIS